MLIAIVVKNLDDVEAWLIIAYTAAQIDTLTRPTCCGSYQMLLILMLLLMLQQFVNDIEFAFDTQDLERTALVIISLNLFANVLTVLISQRFLIQLHLFGFLWAFIVRLVLSDVVRELFSGEGWTVKACFLSWHNCIATNLALKVYI
jgi:hypothetical protein